jgi:hypothetical protein
MARTLFSPPTGEKVFFARSVAIAPIVGARVAGAANCRFSHDKKIGAPDVFWALQLNSNGINFKPQR